VTLPGNTLTRRDSRGPIGPKLKISTPMVVSETQRGADGVLRIDSLAMYESKCGDRTIDTQHTYDWFATHFNNGGAAGLLVSLRGPAAAKASAELLDVTDAVVATVEWNVPGADGNLASIDVDAGSGAGLFTVDLFYDGELLFTSPDLADQVALQTWAAAATQLGKITVTPGVGTDPVPTAAPIVFTGGDDDFDGITPTEIAAAFARFTDDFGTGVYTLPGRTSLTAHEAVADALMLPRINRLARLMMPDLSAVTVSTQALQLRTHEAGDMIDLLAGRMTVEGLTRDTVRSVGLDALRCGCEGRNDAAQVTPNQPAAGTYGEAIWGLALTHQGLTTPWSDDDVELLYDAGVNIAKIVDERIRIYGSRVLADAETEPAAFRLGSARLRMALSELLRYRMENVQFHELDPDGHKVKELQGNITGDVRSYPTSVVDFKVVVEVRPGPEIGTAVLYAAIQDLQAAYDAERIVGEFSRTVTRITTSQEA